MWWKGTPGRKKKATTTTTHTQDFVRNKRKEKREDFVENRNTGYPTVCSEDFGSEKKKPTNTRIRLEQKTK